MPRAMKPRETADSRSLKRLAKFMERHPQKEGCAFVVEGDKIWCLRHVLEDWRLPRSYRARKGKGGA